MNYPSRTARGVLSSYLVVGTPLAIVLDARPVWGNITRTWDAVDILWIGAFALAFLGSLGDLVAPWVKWRWWLRVLACSMYTPVTILMWFGLDGWYHLIASLLLIEGHRTKGRERWSILSFILFLATDVFLLWVDAVPKGGGTVTRFLGVPYMVIVGVAGGLSILATWMSRGRERRMR